MESPYNNKDTASTRWSLLVAQWIHGDFDTINPGSKDSWKTHAKYGEVPGIHCEFIGYLQSGDPQISPNVMCGPYS